jgi:hypothetical protein
MKTHTEELLILTKTYPGPSTRHRETTCVAAVNRQGELRRLFPVPFRFLDGAQQFQKWEWIQARLIRAASDQRPESYKIDIDTLKRTGEKIGTRNRWQERRQWIEPHIVEEFSALELRRQTTGETLGFIRPSRLIELEITPVQPPDWTEEDKAKLLQDGLFDTLAARRRPPLKKLPYDFHYRYECETSRGKEILRHMITDWEVGALYWNCYRKYGRRWEMYLRQKLEGEFAEKDLLFLMGTVHRFPDQWLIVGLVYPPKPVQPTTRAHIEQLGFRLESGDAR